MREQPLIDALYQISCGTNLQTREEMIDAACNALIVYMQKNKLNQLSLTKGANGKPIWPQGQRLEYMGGGKHD